MLTKSEYLMLISKRGDAYGGHGGILDLLEWSGKTNTQEVTLDEARRFYESPSSEESGCAVRDCGS